VGWKGKVIFDRGGWGRLDSLYSLESLERLERLERLESGGGDRKSS